jgi:hypothetical protein
MTPPPIEHDDEPTGGGTPNVPALGVMGASQSPASPFSEAVSAIRETLVEAFGRQEMTTRKVSASTLAMAATGQPFDADRAWEIITAILEGNTMKRACEAAGLSRGTVYAWRLLVPKFDAMVKEAQAGLGEWYRDCAAEDDDAALMSSRLKLAASYDRRLRTTGAEEGDGGSGSILVQVVKLG